LIADCGLRIADCGLQGSIRLRTQIELLNIKSAIRNPQSTIKRLEDEMFQDLRFSATDPLTFAVAPLLLIAAPLSA
jgi:hypothetical protein